MQTLLKSTATSKYVFAAINHNYGETMKVEKQF